MAAVCNDKSALNDAAALFIELDDTMPKNITISYPVDVKLKIYKQKSIWDRALILVDRAYFIIEKSIGDPFRSYFKNLKVVQGMRYRIEMILVLRSGIKLKSGNKIILLPNNQIGENANKNRRTFKLSLYENHSDDDDMLINEAKNFAPYRDDVYSSEK